jgi:hypothetical protein
VHQLSGRGELGRSHEGLSDSKVRSFKAVMRPVPVLLGPLVPLAFALPVETLPPPVCGQSVRAAVLSS